MILTYKLFGIFFLIFLLPDTIYPQNLLDYSNSLKYANYLFGSHQYKLAVSEFERVVFLAPHDTISKLKLIRSYRYSNNFTTARKRIEDFYSGDLNNFPVAFSDEYIKNLLCENQFQEATDFLRKNISLDIDTRQTYQLGIYVMESRWDEASQFVDGPGIHQDRTEKFDALHEVMIKGLNTRYKNPALAASLSAVIPGAGRLYTKQWKDGIFSFLFISAASWLTYKSYIHSGIDLNSILAGTFTLSFYSANIYGSGKSANRYNQRINQTCRTEAEKILLDDKDR